jgi:hypothetical protein
MSVTRALDDIDPDPPTGARAPGANRLPIARRTPTELHGRPT